MNGLQLRLPVFFVAVSVFFSILGGPIIHAIVPHSHEGNIEVWQSLHSALSHDKAESSQISDVFVVVAVLSIVSIASAVAFAIPEISLAMALRRGILPYRRFD